MNIVKWLFATVVTSLVLVGLGTSNLFAKDEWVAKPVLCNDSHDAVRENFYYSEGLVPMMGGTTKTRINAEGDEVDAVIFIMFDYENNSAALMEYHTDFVCALGFMHNMEFNTDKLKEYLNYDDNR